MLCTYSRPHQSFYSSELGHLNAEDAISYPTRIKFLVAFTSLLHTTSETLVLCASLVKLGFDFLVDECFVVFEILLNVDFELDDVV